jgi:hypothetical protein
MNLRLLGGVLIAVVCATNVHAESREDILESLGKCAAISEDKARLACYDALSPHVKEVLATPPKSLDREPTEAEQKSWFGFDLSGLFGASPSQQTTPQQFGSDQLPATHAKEDVAAEKIDSITAHVTDYAYTPFGKFIVFLDNGQVWRQVTGDVDHANFHKVATENTVKIFRAIMGTYSLTINDSAKVFKVDRVK